MADFAETIATAYATEGAALDLGGACTTAPSSRRRSSSCRSMLNRHGLIAGATGTGKTVTLQLIAEQLSAPGVPVFAADVKGDLSGLAAPAGPDDRADERAVELGPPYTPTGFPVDFLVARRPRPGRSGARDRVGLRAAAAGQGARRQRDPGAVARRWSSTTPTRTAAAARSGRPAGPAEFLTRTSGKAELTASAASRRRPPACCCGRSSGSRTAAGTEFFGEPEFASPTSAHRAGRPRGHQLPRAGGRPGPAEAVLDGPDVAARRAVRGAARGRRPRQAQAGVLLRRGPPAVRRRLQGVPRPGGPDRAAHPLQGRRRVLRHPAAEGRARGVLAQLGNRVQHALRAFTPDDAKALKATVSTFPKTPSTTSRRR